MKDWEQSLFLPMVRSFLGTHCATGIVTQEIIMVGVNPSDKSVKVFHLGLTIGLMLLVPENWNYNTGGWNL